MVFKVDLFESPTLRTNNLKPNIVGLFVYSTFSGTFLYHKSPSLKNSTKRNFMKRESKVLVLLEKMPACQL